MNLNVKEPGETALQQPRRTGLSRGINVTALVAGTFAVIGQAAALPLLSVPGGANHWAVAAVFGAGVALVMFTLAGKNDERKMRDFALHDSLTVALVLAAAAVTDSLTAALLLPGAVVLSALAQRLLKNRPMGSVGATLPYVVLIALGSLWIASGEKAFIVSAVTLALASLLRVVGAGTLPNSVSPLSRTWAASAALCAIVAAVDMTRGAALPGMDASLAAIGAGALYGAAMLIGARYLKRATAYTISILVPFASILAFIGLGHIEHPAFYAALTLLGGALLAVRGNNRIARLRQAEDESTSSVFQRQLGWSDVV